MPNLKDPPVEDERSVDAAYEYLNEQTSIRYLRLHWVDLSGVLRTKIIPRERALQLARLETRCGLAQNCMVIPVLPSPSCFAEQPEAWELYPNWSSLRLCGHHPSHATVLCSTELKDGGIGFARCPRRLLHQVLSRYPQDVEFTIGFEIEFVLLNERLEIAKPFDSLEGYGMMAGLRGDTLGVLEEILNALELAGISVYHAHAETKDQLEIALSPGSPMRAIDELMYAQETIRAVCMRHGLKASLAPRPVFSPFSQNGLHLHLSSNSKDVVQNLLTGALEKMKPLCAFGLASVDSYHRVCSDGAGLFIGWGTENRDLPIRRINDDHLEFRFGDATSNWYLFLSTLLCAGLYHKAIAGAERPWKDCSMLLKEDTPGLEKYGIVERMPASLRVTLDAARADADLRDWIGDELLYQYLRVKEQELQKSKDMDDDARRRKYLQFF